jgi:DNA repair exonuclease SbcCD ATPase subunit
MFTTSIRTYDPYDMVDNYERESQFIDRSFDAEYEDDRRMHIMDRQLRTGRSLLPEGADVGRAQRMLSALSHGSLERGEQCLRMVSADAHMVAERRRQLEVTEELERDRNALHQERNTWHAQIRSRQNALNTVEASATNARNIVTQLDQRIARRTNTVADLDRRVLEATRSLAAIERSTAEALKHQAQDQEAATEQPSKVVVAAVAVAAVVAAHGDDDCAVCCSALDINAAQHSASEVVSTACKHRLHRTCLAQWMLKQNSCPLCRAKLML